MTIKWVEVEFDIILLNLFDFMKFFELCFPIFVDCILQALIKGKNPKKKSGLLHI